MKPLTILTALAALAVASCNNSEKKESNDSKSSDGHPLQSYLLDKTPEGAVSVVEARKNPAPGTEVVISGKVMGKPKPFVNGNALVTIGDPTKITSCDLMPGDSCATPWDVCCDDTDVIKGSIATIQVVDEDGSPLKHGLKGLGEMKELSSLVIKGTVAEGSNADNLLINASGIHVAMVEPTKDNPAKP